MPTPPWQPPAEVSGSAPMFSTTDVVRLSVAPPSTRTPYRLSLQTLAGQSPLIVTRLMMTTTPVPLAPPAVAAQISSTDCGTWLAVSVAWQLVVDPTGLASPSMVTRPDRGACTMFRLLVIVTCSWYVPGHISIVGGAGWLPVSAASAAVTADCTVLYPAVAQSVLAFWSRRWWPPSTPAGARWRRTWPPTRRRCRPAPARRPRPPRSHVVLLLPTLTLALRLPLGLPSISDSGSETPGRQGWFTPQSCAPGLLSPIDALFTCA